MSWKDPREYIFERQMVSDHWQKLLKEKPSVVLICYPDDEGVKKNQGRAGAAKGPERIVHFLSRLPVHFNQQKTIYVAEDVIDTKEALEARHEAAEQVVFEFLTKGWTVITIGGGHDYGFPDSSAFHRQFSAPILNIDAHTDLRPVLNKSIHSGTPFFRFRERFPEASLKQWGLQMNSNAPPLLDYARSKQIELHSWRAQPPSVPALFGLSLCLDAIENLRAVSAPASYGLSASQMIKFIEEKTSSCPWLGVYESAPELDASEDSARLAAKLISTFIHQKEGIDEGRLFS